MPDLLIHKDGSVTRLTLNRPEALNALTNSLHHALSDAIDNFAADESQQICVITGAGSKAFCAGSDLKEGLSGQYPKSGYAGLAERFDLNKPVIAAVNGFALGGGFELALACDLIIASETASFGLPEPLVGAIALGGGLHRLQRQVGLKNAMALTLTSRRVDAAEGKRLGFVNEVVPARNLNASVRAWCDDILKGSPVAVQASKAVMRRSLGEPSLQSAMKAQADYPEFQVWKNSEDVKEGINAFNEKRPPKWTGR